MKTYKVAVEYTSWGLVPVEAKNKEDLMEKLQSDAFVDEMSLPENPEYIEDSYSIDFDYLDSLGEE